MSEAFLIRLQLSGPRRADCFFSYLGQEHSRKEIQKVLRWKCETEGLADRKGELGHGVI